MIEIEVVGIYVLPTETGLPPRALLLNGDQEEGMVAGVQVTWTADMGTWCLEGDPLPNELSEAITQHAKNLGVESFL